MQAVQGCKPRPETHRAGRILIRPARCVRFAADWRQIKKPALGLTHIYAGADVLSLQINPKTARQPPDCAEAYSSDPSGTSLNSPLGNILLNICLPLRTSVQNSVTSLSELLTSFQEYCSALLFELNFLMFCTQNPSEPLTTLRTYHLSFGFLLKSFISVRFRLNIRVHQSYLAPWGQGQPEEISPER